MSIIKSLIGRRQFLVATGAASVSALAFKKLAGVFAPGSKTSGAMAVDSFNSIAMAAEKPGTAGTKGSNNRYPHLLSPIKIRNVIVKNRIMSRVGAPPHFLQGPETYHTEVLRSYYSTIAKGAAIIPARLTGTQGVSRENMRGDSAQMARFDDSNPATQNYVDQIIEGIHSMGSLVQGGNVSGNTIKEAVVNAKKLQDKGYDVAGIGFRGDNTFEIAQAVKAATNLILTTSIRVQDPLTRPQQNYAGTNSFLTVEQAIEVAKDFEGIADILLIVMGGSMPSHPTNWSMEKGKPATINICQAIKESGAKILLAPNGGFHEPDLNEEFIASGKCDFIVMARAFNADFEYGKKIYDGRGEDVVPCLRCNRCHGISMDGPWYSACSVNPRMGLDSTVKVIDAPTMLKKVAVIGGGPGGMKAAITAAERGHKVTLYEKNDYLGGLLRHTDFDPCKWPHKEYKDYLIYQIKKLGVEVKLSTTATPEMIKSKGYDVVLAAVGAEPVTPRIPGWDGKDVWKGIDVYGREKELGKDVIFIGGGEYGVETAMYLAKAGHNVMVLTDEKELMSNIKIHYDEFIIDAYDQMRNFDYITEATAKGISGGKVTYTDAKGNEKSIQADSVVIYGGLRPRMDEAVTFSGSANKAFYAVGDCTGRGGDLQKCNRTAFFMASQI